MTSHARLKLTSCNLRIDLDPRVCGNERFGQLHALVDGNSTSTGAGSVPQTHKNGVERKHRIVGPVIDRCNVRPDPAACDAGSWCGVRPVCTCPMCAVLPLPRDHTHNACNDTNEMLWDLMLLFSRLTLGRRWRRASCCATRHVSYPFVSFSSSNARYPPPLSIHR